MSEKASMFSKLSVQTKIIATLLLVFLLVLVVSLGYSASSERSLIQKVVEQQTKDAADSYFDSINTMMITGTMAQRGVLRNKVLSRPGVIDARIVRGEPVAKVYGKGTAEEQPTDELDHRALAGESIMEIRNTPDGRVLTVLNPIKAEKDYRGTNCLLCHQVPADTVVGAVRVSYSLKALDDEVSRGLLASAGFQAVLFAVGLLLMVVMLTRVVTRPINALRGTMEAIEQDSDLSRTIDTHCGSDCKDEISAMANAFNSMVGKFRASMQEVSSSTHQLASVAQRVAAVSEETVRAVYEQRAETEQLATAMNEMAATVQEVARNASQTAEASQGADGEARNGAYVATEALGGIDALVGDVERAASVIQKLDEQSGNIGMVLDVIKGIAEQTNLLALNAAIEAARAGEQGRGFAVVADEVRTLATRTHDSTREIQRMIEELQLGAQDAVKVMEQARNRAQNGSEQVERAAESLGMIAGEVSSISDMNTQIATAAEEQSNVAEEINRNVANIGQVADKTSEGSRQTAQVSEELVQLSNQLESLVGRFRL